MFCRTFNELDLTEFIDGDVLSEVTNNILNGKVELIIFDCVVYVYFLKGSILASQSLHRRPSQIER